jgi:uncharacterized protein with GYD domain
MPKYLVKATYVGDGLKGLLKEGGVARRAAAEKGIKSMGGTMEAFYFAFGDADAYVLADLPDLASMTALSLAINASGLVKVQTTTLLTAEEVDTAAKRTPSYRAPGQ